jgi:hypothetical protein
MMASELWEIVRAEELKAGDFCKIFYGGLMLEARKIEEVHKYDDGKVSVYFDGSSVMFDGERTVLRRHTGHHPDVLMRALQNLARTHVEDVCVYRDDDHEATEIADWVTICIAEAEAEIAKERES